MPFAISTGSSTVLGATKAIVQRSVMLAEIDWSWSPSALTWLLVASCAIAAAAFVMARVNLALYQVLGRPKDDPSENSGSEGASRGGLIAVCIPARNEEANLEACVRGVLSTTPRAIGERVRVLVYDDQSQDETPRILQRLVGEDARVVRVPTNPLPEGWNGKQHACWRMAEHAMRQLPDGPAEWLLFTDADVRFEAGCIAQTVAAAGALKADLVSTFPRQITGTFAERSVVPMIFFILFSYLPFARMRRTLDPASSAGCGQFLFVSSRAYAACGGHATFKDSMHDGIKLPRAVRKAGFKSDLFDGTDVVSCRMYDGWTQTWRGFAKNAYEGLGSPVLLVFLTMMHVVGHLLPWGALFWMIGRGIGLWGTSTTVAAADAVLAVVAIGLALTQRTLLARRLKLDASPLLHPVGIVLMTLIQWHSFVLHLTGRRTWRGRTLTPAGA